MRVFFVVVNMSRKKTKNWRQLEKDSIFPSDILSVNCCHKEIAQAIAELRQQYIEFIVRQTINNDRQEKLSIKDYV